MSLDGIFKCVELRRIFPLGAVMAYAMLSLWPIVGAPHI
jgi:hypothetical protein